MVDIASERIVGVDYKHIKQLGYHRIHCVCGNILFIWADRNSCTCHRARCWRCKEGPSYILKTGRRKGRSVMVLIAIGDSYEEQVKALSLNPRECDIDKETEEEKESMQLQLV